MPMFPGPVAAPQPPQQSEYDRLLLQILSDPNFKAQDQSDSLRQQMEWAQKMAQPSGVEYSTGGGAAFGALGDVLRGIGGQVRTGRLNAEQQANAEQVAKGQQLRARLTQLEELRKEKLRAAEEKAKEERKAIQDRAEWEHRNKVTSAQQAERDARQNAAHLREAQTLAGLRIAEERAKADAPAKGTVIPGMEVTEDAAPTAEDAKKVKASVAAAERMGSYISELRALHNQHGTELTGPVASRMGQLMTAIRLEGKNIADLGALSGPDMGLMEQLSGEDPSSWWANTKGLVGVDNTDTALSGLEKWTTDTVEGNKRAYGYRDRPSVVPPSAGPVQIKSDAEWNALPSGAEYIDPNGQHKRKR